jgi:asparagine synthase (glutamine-hydrolysing)
VTAIAGIWQRGGADDPRRACARMLKSLAMYGPDHEAAAEDGPLAVGRALARLLPEDVHDRGPVRGGGGRFLLAADIRIDGRAALAAAIGTDLGAKSDAALLMAAWERWGEACLERLNGDYAFAVWDREEARLTLARDPLGRRPLHYHAGAHFFAFASMAKGLHALPDVPYAPDPAQLADFLALLPDTGSATWFRHIEKVPAGCLLRVDAGGRAEASRWWRPAPAALRLKRTEEYEDALRAAMDEAVADRLRGAGAIVGAHLSGGLDSSTVAATAARLRAPSGRVIGFTAVPREGFDERPRRGRFYDEGPLAAATAARHANLEQVRVPDGGSPVAGFDAYFHAMERPVLNPCNGVWMDRIDAEAKRRGIKVLLTGDVGNMSFSYTGFDALPQLFRRGRWLKLGRLALGLARNGVRPATIGAQTIGPYLPGWLWRRIEAARGFDRALESYTLLDEAAARRLGTFERAAARGLDLDYRPKADGAARRLWALQRSDAGNYMKAALALHGIDRRDPTGDRRLIELCLSIPSEIFLAGGMPRGLARRAFLDRVPEEVAFEGRKGLQAADWHEHVRASRDELVAEAERILASPAAAELIDEARLRRLIEEWPDSGWESNAVMQRYRLGLLRGLSAGHFLRRASGSNA